MPQLEQSCIDFAANPKSGSIDWEVKVLKNFCKFTYETSTIKISFFYKKDKWNILCEGAKNFEFSTTENLTAKEVAEFTISLVSFV